MVRKEAMVEAMNLMEVGYTHSDGMMRELVASLPDLDYDRTTLKTEVDRLYTKQRENGWDVHRITRKAWLMAAMARNFDNPHDKKIAIKAIYWSDHYGESTK